MSVESPKEEPIISPDVRIDPVILMKVRQFAHCLAVTSQVEKDTNEGRYIWIYHTDKDGNNVKDKHGREVGTCYPTWLNGMITCNLALFEEIKEALGPDIPRKIIQTHQRIHKTEIPQGILNSYKNERKTT